MRTSKITLTQLEGFARQYGSEPKVFSHTVVVIKSSNPDLTNPFLLWVLRSTSFFREINLRMNSNSGVPTLGVEFLKMLRIPVPKPPEQEAIVSILNAARKMEDAEISTLQKLRALKLGLMYDLLTGRTPTTPPLAGVS
jgi:type I restriction enzyme S subunit